MNCLLSLLRSCCTRGPHARTGQQSHLTLPAPYLPTSAVCSSLACCVSLVSATIFTCTTGREGIQRAAPAPPTTCTASTHHHLHSQHLPPPTSTENMSFFTHALSWKMSFTLHVCQTSRKDTINANTHTHAHTPLAPCPAISNHTGQLHDPTRTVIDGHLEPYKSSVGSQPSLNAAAQRRSINVTTTQWNYNTALKGPRQLMRNAQHSDRELGLTSSPAAAG